MLRRLLLTSYAPWLATVLLCFGAPLAASRDTQQVAAADNAFTRSLATHDEAALDGLLDRDFTWISSDGKTQDRASVLRSFPAPANGEAKAQLRLYGKAAVARADRGQVHVLRIWILRPSGWHALLYQEVKQVARSEKQPPGSPDCENPCRTIPFTPQTAAEKGAIASWQGVMRAMAIDDAEAYAALIADEFTATDTFHDRPYTKPERIAQIHKLKATGAHGTPPPMVSARMFDLGQTVVMIAREQRPQAKAYFNTRMWVHRDGRWQMLFSFNTRIE